MNLKNTISLLLLSCSLSLTAQTITTIPDINEVGAKVMPASIMPYRGNPFNMPQLDYPVFPNRSINIKDKGAIVIQPITELVNKLIAEMSSCGGGKVIIPKGKWKSSRIILKSNVNLYLEEGAVIEFSGKPEDYLPSVYTLHEGRQIMGAGAFIYAYNEENIAVTGKGRIYGPSMDCAIRKNSNSIAFIEDSFPTEIEQRVFDGIEGRRFFAPKVFSPIKCKSVLIEGITIERSLFWNVNPVYCENVIIRGVTVNSVGIPSGDGIDITCCKNTLIEYCTLNCGDDCFTLKGGRDEEGMRMGIPTENVIIRHSLAKKGDGGITTGSETGGNIRNIYAYDCVFDGTRVCLRFKTRRPRTGITEGILYENLRMRNVGNVFEWDLLGSKTFVGELAERMPLRPVTKATPNVRNVQVRNFDVESSTCFVKAQGIPELPLCNITIESGIIRCQELIPFLNDFDGITMRNLSITSEDNKLNILDGKNLLLDKVVFSIPENKLYIKTKGEHSSDVKCRDVHPQTEIINE